MDKSFKERTEERLCRITDIFIQKKEAPPQHIVEAMVELSKPAPYVPEIRIVPQQ